jgi:drug/metabolite transporter (DMT)-like permease
MSWLLLTFISVVCRAVYGMMSKILSTSAKTSAYTQATLLSSVSAVLALLATPLLGGITTNFSKVSILTVILVAAGQGLGNIFYFTAIKSLTNGTAQIAFSSILVFNTLLSIIFLNLHLSAINMLGILILLIAIVSVVSGKVVFDRRGVALMCIGAFFFAVFQLSSSQLSHQVSAATYLLIAYAGGALIVFAIKARTVIGDVHKPGFKLALRNSAYAAIPSIGNFLFAYYAYRSAPTPAIVAILLTSQVVVTILLGYVFLKERDNLGRKFTAAVLVVVSAVLIKR